MEDFSVSLLGDTALLVKFGDAISTSTHHRVQTLASLLERRPPVGYVEHVPAYTSIAIVYDPLATSPESLIRKLEALWTERPITNPADDESVVVPVCYGGEYGPDLGFVAEHNGLTENDVVKIHTSVTYRVYMIGFVPGFPYMGEVPTQIRAPRKTEPRLAVAKGSVGIAGIQTGIYSFESPGGWQIIGRTPVSLFHPDKQPPTFFKPGQLVRFRAIDSAEFVEMKEGMQ